MPWRWSARILDTKAIFQDKAIVKCCFSRFLLTQQVSKLNYRLEC